MASHPELEFFNTISGSLKIELDVPPKRVGNLLNERAESHARIVQIKLIAEIFVPEQDQFRPLTPTELDSVAFQGKTIQLRNEDAETVVTYKAPNGKQFTVKELLNAIEETERQTRGQTDWLDGIDVHHVFIEGIEESDDAVWEIMWGS